MHINLQLATISNWIAMDFKTNPNAKTLGETQTLRTGCSKAERKMFATAADPLPGGAGQPKFNQLEMVATFNYKLSLVRIDARNFELSW